MKFSNANRLDSELRHNLRRCSKLSDAEMRLLALVASYSKGCLLTYREICRHTGWSLSKLKRVIGELIKNGLLSKVYRAYKRVTLKIASARTQTEFAQGSDGVKAPDAAHAKDLLVADCIVKPKADRSTSDPMMAHPWTHDSSPVSHPILERELKRKEETAFQANAWEQRPKAEPICSKPVDVMRLLQDAIAKVRAVGT